MDLITLCYVGRSVLCRCSKYGLDVHGEKCETLWKQWESRDETNPNNVQEYSNGGTAKVGLEERIK